MHRSLMRMLLTINIFLAILWIYQGLVPKIMYKVVEEQRFWSVFGFNENAIFSLIKMSGYVEIFFGLLFIAFRKSKILHYINISAMLIFFIVVMALYPYYFSHAFNPFVMNIGMTALSIVALQLLHLDQQIKS